MSWIVMFVAIAGLGVAVVSYTALARRSKLTGGLAAGAIVVAASVLAWWLGQEGETPREPVAILSPDQPPGVRVDRSSGVRVATEDRGLLLVLRGQDQDLPMLTVRTLTAAFDERSHEEHYRDGIAGAGGTFDGDFGPAPLGIAPSARGVAWHTGDRQMHVWLVDRAPDVATFFQCVTPLGGEPEHACDLLLSSVTLDPDFVPRTEDLDRAE